MNYNKSLLFSVFLSIAFLTCSSLFVFAEDQIDILQEETSSLMQSETIDNPLPAVAKEATGWLGGISKNIDLSSIDYRKHLDKALYFSGCLLWMFLAEQGIEYGIHLINKSYANHAKRFKEEVLRSGLNISNTNLSCDDEHKLKTLASEFRNPLYRYTIGWFKKNKIENWLESEITQKQANSSHKIDEKALNGILVHGSY